MYYDLIGDVHGHASELKALLIKMGYEPNPKYNNAYSYKIEDSDEIVRKAIFVGDLIDRGPEIRETLQIVKKMVDNGTALCIMGNHEYNAIGFWHQPQFRSSQSIKNINQHAATVKAFQNRQSEWLDEYVEWFKTLPIMLELPELRVVHAAWIPGIYALTIPPKQYPDPVFITKDFRFLTSYFYTRPKEVRQVVELVLKGNKVNLPDNLFYSDKDGNKRTASRTNWWVSTTSDNATYDQLLEPYTIKELPELDKKPIDQNQMPAQAGYDPNAKPIFFGHYALKNVSPHLQAPNVCCLDYGMGKGGNLIAYRWSGEKTLTEENLIVQEAIQKKD